MVKELLRCQRFKGTSVQLLNSHLQTCRVCVSVCAPVFTFANEQTICLSKSTCPLSQLLKLWAQISGWQFQRTSPLNLTSSGGLHVLLILCSAWKKSRSMLTIAFTHFLTSPSEQKKTPCIILLYSLFVLAVKLIDLYKTKEGSWACFESQLSKGSWRMGTHCNVPLLPYQLQPHVPAGDWNWWDH